MQNPTREEILCAVESAKDADYCFVVCVGGGDTAKRDLPWPETLVSLAGGVDVTERELNSGAPRCFLLLDCSAASSEHLPPIAIERGPENLWQRYRSAYDKAVQAAEGGLVKLVAMDANAAHPSVSEAILCEAEQWAAGHEGVLPFGEAVRRAASRGKTLPRLQYGAGRRLREFPLAVSLPR